MSAEPTLVPLPAQPVGVPWPTRRWPTGPLPQQVAARVAGLVDEIFADRRRYGTTFAVVVVQAGRLVCERYGGALEHFDRPPTPVVVDTPLRSWSMAKSMVHALVGMLVAEGRLDLDVPAAVPRWREPAGDPRAAITLEQLLAMRDGLAFREDYEDGSGSDVIEMLFGQGASDVAAFAADMPLAHEPGTVYNYSSGTTNIISRIVGDVISPGVTDPAPRVAAMRDFMTRRLFGPIGMASAVPSFDAAGTFVGSSYVDATARDFARFGMLYLRDGVWDGHRILAEGWVDHGRRMRSIDPDDGRGYGAHWWVVGDDLGTFWANGYEGQSIMCVPALDALVVRLGRTPQATTPNLLGWRARMREALAGVG